jgi:hypothetical protein
MTIRNTWKQLMKGRPGHRFQSQYRRRQQERRSPLRRVLFVGGGILIMAAGAFLLAAPGPGVLVVFLGGALVAQESLTAARTLDWAEVRLRHVSALALDLWEKASLPVKIVLVLAGLAAVGIAAYAGYRLFF